MPTLEEAVQYERTVTMPVNQSANPQLSERERVKQAAVRLLSIAQKCRVCPAWLVPATTIDWMLRVESEDVRTCITSTSSTCASKIHWSLVIDGRRFVEWW